MFVQNKTKSARMAIVKPLVFVIILCLTGLITYCLIMPNFTDGELTTANQDQALALRKRANWSAQSFVKDFSVIVAATAGFTGAYVLNPTAPIIKAACFAVIGITTINTILAEHTADARKKRNIFEKDCFFSHDVNATVCVYNLHGLAKRSGSAIDYFNITGAADIISETNQTRGLLSRSWDETKSVVVSKMNNTVLDILNDMQLQAENQCHGECHMSNLAASNFVKRDQQWFQGNWACYEYKENSAVNNLMWMSTMMDQATDNGNSDGNLPNILTDFYNQYPQWKTCIGVNSGYLNGNYDQIPDGRMYRGELYYNTCGGLDGQCGDDYGGADDHSSIK